MRGLLGFLPLIVAVGACRTDHDALAKRDEPKAGAGGLGGGGVGGSSAGTSSGGTGGSGAQFGIPDVVLPDGDDVVTLVHGQSDAERIAFCFAERKDEALELVADAPLPRGGLGYGQSVSTKAPAALSLQDDDIQVVVVAGDESSLDVEDCESLLEDAWEAGLPQVPLGEGGAAGEAGQAPPPRLRYQRMPVIPAGSLSRGRNALVVLSGCMGAPHLIPEDALALCGDASDSGRSTLRPVVALASRRRAASFVGLQFMHASLPTGPATLQALPALGGSASARLIASRVMLGQLMPRDADTTFDTAFYEIGAGGKVEILEDGQRRFQITFEEIADNIGAELPQDGHSYALVLLGPAAGFDAPSGYNASTLTLIDTSQGAD